jgi:hypothetical protein
MIKAGLPLGAALPFSFLCFDSTFASERWLPEREVGSQSQGRVPGWQPE